MEVLCLPYFAFRPPTVMASGLQVKPALAKLRSSVAAEGDALAIPRSALRMTFFSVVPARVDKKYPEVGRRGVSAIVYVRLVNCKGKIFAKHVDVGSSISQPEIE